VFWFRVCVYLFRVIIYYWHWISSTKSCNHASPLSFKLSVYILRCINLLFTTIVRMKIWRHLVSSLQTAILVYVQNHMTIIFENRVKETFGRKNYSSVFLLLSRKLSSMFYILWKPKVFLSVCIWPHNQHLSLCCGKRVLETFPANIALSRAQLMFYCENILQLYVNIGQFSVHSVGLVLCVI
jgi:hypothetical protein